MGRGEIADIRGEPGVDEFLSRFFAPEVPVVLRGIAADWPARQVWSAAWLHERFADDPSVRAKRLWFETNAEQLDEHLTVPRVVNAALDPSRAYIRESNARVWTNEQGNVTGFHYDANSLFVFNVQIRGRKSWTIVSPRTPLPFHPFVPLVPTDRAAAHLETDYLTFELEEGDMVFVPPYWAHRVVSEAPENVNLNWVGTKRSGRVASAVADRDAEILKFWALVDRVAPQPYVRNYGGGGRPLVDELIAPVSTGRLLRGLGREVASLPHLVRNSEDRALIAAVKKEQEAETEQAENQQEVEREPR